MKRIEKVYNYLNKVCSSYSRENLDKCMGVSAQEIGNELGILRNNVSKELNDLCRDKRAIKIKCRPVRYFDRKIFEELFNVILSNEVTEIEDIESLIKPIEETKEKSPFDYLIGSDTSLKTQVEQAKAAIMYPPNGLHTLIVGPTGVGKSLFANIMYSYAKYIGKLDENSPFIVFNCADYYNNPQLLLSYIFGHVKGAFTGADSDKEGIVEKANGGILFLDEIHRLPPEGQEMIFYFMDTGTFNKLGETERKRKANVLIIGATTEDPNSALLSTFVRRIPITIRIPSFEERSVADKIDIIKHLFHNEAVRVNKPIKISVEAIKALIGSTTFGNIGQLKSNIQLLCAKGFLNSINGENYIDINLKMMPNNIQSGLLGISSGMKEKEEIINLVSSELVINPDKNAILLEGESNYDPPFNLYKIIEDKASILREEGMDEEAINKFITTDITVHIKCFYDRIKNDKYSREGLLKIVDEKIINFSQEIKALAEERLGRNYNDRFLYAISLHMSAFFNRLNQHIEPDYEEMQDIIKEYPKEYKVAEEICKKAEKYFNTQIPKGEAIYITILLTSIEDNDTNKKVGVVVATHGSSTASSMVNVAVKLFDSDNIVAVDMPLEISPKETLEFVTQKVKQIDRGRGVMLLVDMGSLNSFGNIIYEETGIKIRTLDMVSTPTVLEAARKSSLNDVDLEGLYQYLKEFKGYSINKKENDSTSRNKGVIITVCSSGKGAAIKLKELVVDIVKNISDENVEVIPIGIKNCKEKIKEIRKNNKVLSIVGSIDPKLNIPFISLESLISGKGEKIIERIFKGESLLLDDEIQEDIVLSNLCYDSLKETMTYLNPDKINNLLLEFTNILEEITHRDFTNSMKVRIVLHTACALERVLTNDQLKYSYDKENLDESIVNGIKQATYMFKETLNLQLSDDEIYYLAEILLL
ncbi:sigma 54-interacting transcriptional regulator [Clostridium sp.]|uniref:sigma 54-interacting transcriptional regulator n=1 Tax=Clostridium sp. TaxID=1506 RepID=UPI001E10015C|nr:MULTISPECIES: sigma-54-dependent transcriptional regulator [Clostridia]MBW4861314.1 sigma 54-interacting transcriptional regulator [Paeniclostridium sp.]MDO5039806.1 sigma 54-interacting transcriptional regulator [Clostridium sp.]